MIDAAYRCHQWVRSHQRRALGIGFLLTTNTAFSSLGVQQMSRLARHSCPLQRPQISPVQPWGLDNPMMNGSRGKVIKLNHGSLEEYLPQPTAFRPGLRISWARNTRTQLDHQPFKNGDRTGGPGAGWSLGSVKVSRRFPGSADLEPAEQKHKAWLHTEQGP